MDKSKIVCTKTINYNNEQIPIYVMKAGRTRLKVGVRRDGIYIKSPCGTIDERSWGWIESNLPLLYEDYKTKQAAEAPIYEKKMEQGFACFDGKWLKVVKYVTPKEGNLSYVIGEETIDIYVNPKYQQVDKMQLVMHVMKFEAKKRLPEWTYKIAKEMGLSGRLKKVTIKETKTRWGSCSSRGNINLSWRVMAAPKELQHYLLVHEVAHLKEMNHSPNFWMLVEKHCTNAQQKDKVLNENFSWVVKKYFTK